MENVGVGIRNKPAELPAAGHLAGNNVVIELIRIDRSGLSGLGIVDSAAADAVIRIMGAAITADAVLRQCRTCQCRAYRCRQDPIQPADRLCRFHAVTSCDPKTLSYLKRDADPGQKLHGREGPY